MASTATAAPISFKVFFPLSNSIHGEWFGKSWHIEWWFADEGMWPAGNKGGDSCRFEGKDLLPSEVSGEADE